jgi:acetoin utilization deacetylase AcuC-like enzyme
MISSIGKNGELLKIFYSDTFPIHLPPDHRFPGDKYRLLRESIIEDGLTPEPDLLIPDPASNTDILLVHDSDYLDKIIAGSLSEKEVRRLGFPWSPELVERSRRSVGGTIAACRTAINDGIGVNLAGGTHQKVSLNEWSSWIVMSTRVMAPQLSFQKMRVCSLFQSMD